MRACIHTDTQILLPSPPIKPSMHARMRPHTCARPGTSEAQPCQHSYMGIGQCHTPLPSESAAGCSAAALHPSGCSLASSAAQTAKRTQHGVSDSTSCCDSCTSWAPTSLISASWNASTALWTECGAAAATAAGGGLASAAVTIGFTATAGVITATASAAPVGTLGRGSSTEGKGYASTPSGATHPGSGRCHIGLHTIGRRPSLQGLSSAVERLPRARGHKPQAEVQARGCCGKLMPASPAPKAVAHADVCVV